MKVDGALSSPHSLETVWTETVRCPDNPETVSTITKTVLIICLASMDHFFIFTVLRFCMWILIGNQMRLTSF